MGVSLRIAGATPVLTGVLNTTPNRVWGRLAERRCSFLFDANGNFYFETGNGTFSPYRVGDQVFGLDANSRLMGITGIPL